MEYPEDHTIGGTPRDEINVAAPSEPVEDNTDQTPPIDYEPQVDLAPGQEGGITVRPPDLIEDAEAEDPDNQSEDDGSADDDDDGAEDADDGGDD